MAGKRVDLSALADEPRLPDARVPRFASQGQNPVPVDQVAPNPLNTRLIDADAETIAALRESIRENGQLQASTVVHRKAFLDIFPEYEGDIGVAPYVQVTGARRRIALQQLGRPMDIAVKDELAQNRSRFVAATAAENFDREDYNAIEEAHAVQLIVTESGSTAAAGERLGRTKTWVIQRTNLLKLDVEVQKLIREAQVPLRDVRTLHTHPTDKQMAILRAYQEQKRTESREEEEAGTQPTTEERVPHPRSAATTAASAVRRLGGTPPKIAESLRSVLSSEDLRQLAEILLTEQTP
ncbi:ParB/RepB/Spo0J family partition protein [Actinoplanes siamensis]|uniref:ParB family chromosome partitioning protein n=1 Tax=Actinoplanes siamensis TaxID=1223317 RepID=A0A919TMY8_9ACTN|nr:ParB N-terminal domain-containing protein [Actinoplanes siamensis]GIF08886.1 hypothetical protein Asi03nite_64240 [Actinoplanes siamensis]